MIHSIKKSKERGVIMIIAFMSLGILLLLGYYFLSFTTTETKISKGQEISSKTYYLAEAGINEAIWKLKNDEVTSDGDDPWETCFISNAAQCLDCSSWTDTFSVNYTKNSTTTVSIQNSQCGRGQIIATSTISLAKGKVSQRVVKVTVLKNYGGLTSDSALFSGNPSGETKLQSSILNIYDGNIFNNNTLNVKWSVLSVYDNLETEEKEGQILVAGNFNNTVSTISAEGICSKNGYCTAGVCEKCPPDAKDMPAIDFDSGDSHSYLNRAQAAQDQGQCYITGKNSNGVVVVTSTNCILTESELNNLLSQIGLRGTLTLIHRSNGDVYSVYYVQGGIELKGGRRMEVNGILVADGTINIGEKLCWSGISQCDLSQITITDPGVGIPSGLITKGKINFGLFSSFTTVSIRGLVYSQDETRITSLPAEYNIIGGMIASKFSLTSVWFPFNIYLDNDIIREGIWGGADPPEPGVPLFSPVVTIDHWEETY